MTKTKVDFSVFEFDKHFWVGRHDVRWLAKDTFFVIDTEEDPIPAEQRVIVEFVCSLPKATRKKLEKCLFQSYQSEIYSSSTEDWTPPIHKSAEIWELLSQPGINIPSDDEIDADAYFAATFECVWDPEHGLSILFNDRGEPIDVADNHFS